MATRSTDTTLRSFRNGYLRVTCVELVTDKCLRERRWLSAPTGGQKEHDIGLSLYLLEIEKAISMTPEYRTATGCVAEGDEQQRENSHEENCDRVCDAGRRRDPEAYEMRDLINGVFD